MKKDYAAKKIFNNCKKGSTMVETLVSFTVLFIVLASLYSVVAFSSNLYMQSVDLGRLKERFYREIYKSEDAIKESDFVIRKEYKAGYRHNNDVDERAALTLTLDTEKCSMAGSEEMKNSYISLNRIKVYSYVYNEDYSEKNALIPKAVVFDYFAE